MISFRNVSLVYPNSAQTILEDLSFDLVEGEMVLVIGQTGVGKSSILRLINGLVPHHTGGILSGEIEVAGRSTRLLKPGQLADVVGIVGQNPSNGFVCELVEDEIAFTLETLGIAPDVMRKRVEEVLDLLALAPLRRRELATLSGGEQQRVAIAAALVTQPKVLLLDEPTSALDPIAAEEVLSILHRLVHDLGLTVVLAEHRLERVIQFADRVLLIRGAGAVELGGTREVLANSPIAPPLVELARELGIKEVPLSIREFRRHPVAISDGVVPPPRVIGAPIAQYESVAASYNIDGEEFALRDISFEVAAGEIVALMGRNGAGKSTLLRCLVGMSPITRGRVRVLGRNPKELQGAELISAVGFIPQDAGDLLICESVAAECEQADYDNGVAAGTTLAIYRTLMTTPSELAHPRDLSEGQRLGLVLSIIISARPRLIVLDEPTRGLDYAAKRTLIEILKELASNERAVLLATHDVELVAELADRVLFISEGELIADGAARDVLTASPPFAPQVAKALPDRGWLSVSEVSAALRP
jgi:energy-coupling factor transport system ATP-binding protein